jgi:DNA-binding response OmpR family regulator
MIEPAFAIAYPLEILVADHDPADLAATSRLLAQFGYKPDQVASVGEIVHTTAAKSYDVILLDLRIPDVETIIENSERNPSLKPLFIAVAGTSNNFRITTLLTRVDSHITRPMDETELSLQLKACSVLAGKCCIRATS